MVTAAGREFDGRHLCAVAGISRSGYYRWLSCAPDRVQREKADYEQHLVNEHIFQQRNQKAGWRVIKMNLERKRSS